MTSVQSCEKKAADSLILRLCRTAANGYLISRKNVQYTLGEAAARPPPGNAARLYFVGTTIRAPAGTISGASTGDSGRLRGPGVVVDGADPTLMSREEIRAYGAKKYPPGQHPGTALHQQGSKFSRLMAREMLPLYPLFGMVGLGLTLALYTAGQELVNCPATNLHKGRRQHSLREADEGHKLERDWGRYFGSSLYRHLGARSPEQVGYDEGVAGHGTIRKRVETQA